MSAERDTNSSPNEGEGKGSNGESDNAGSQQDRNGDEEKSEGPPLPVGFWHSSLKGVRAEVFKEFALTSSY